MNKFVRSVVYVLMGTVSHIASAQAACLSPAGEAGDQIYNSAHNVMQYCNGSDWIAMGSSAGGGGADADTLGDLACGNGESIQYNGTIWTCVPGKVSRSGDTMTGPLLGTSATFSSTVGVATPTAAGHATTKQYVDDAVSSLGTAPLTCAGGVNPQVYNGHCYTSFVNADAFPNANTNKEMVDHCKAWGGPSANLVIINDAGEQAFITAQYAAATTAFIGLTDDGRFGSSEGNPRWYDGSAVGYTNWNGTPNQHANRDWVRLQADGTWRYENSLLHNYICEATTDHASELGAGMCSETMFNGTMNMPPVGCGAAVDHTYCKDGFLYIINSFDYGPCPAPTDADESDGDMMWLKALDPDVLEQMNYNKAKGKL